MDLQRIPVFEYARAGSKSLVFDGEPSYYIATSKSKDDSRFGVVVKGNSMEPEIREGEIVVVSKKRDVKDGDVCLVLFKDAEACLRRVYFHDHGVTLTSANEKDYPPTLHKKSEIRTMYRMVQKITNY
jgi:repressor LexA